MQIADCFIFYNELKMLDYRLHVLNHVVDYFILVEATHTHVGKPKSLFFQDNKHLFTPYLHKIIHIVVDDFPLIEGDHWLNENFQRNCISRGIEKLTLNPKDLILISDVDEIPDPILLSEFKRLNYSIEINSLEQHFYYYTITCRSNEKWYKAKIMSYDTYKRLALTCTDIRHRQCPFVFPGGWHLSYFGDKDFIQNKIQNFAHQEFNLPHILDGIEENVRLSTDLFSRDDIIFTKIPISENKYLPPYLRALEAISNGT